METQSPLESEISLLIFRSTLGEKIEVDLWLSTTIIDYTDQGSWISQGEKLKADYNSVHYRAGAEQRVDGNGKPLNDNIQRMLASEEKFYKYIEIINTFYQYYK